MSSLRTHPQFKCAAECGGSRSPSKAWGPSRRPCRRRPGFTVGGLLLATAAAALCLAVFIPCYLRAKDRATDRSTMADMRMVERAILRCIEDTGKAPTSPNGIVQYQKPFFRELLPYLDFVRPVDWWGYNYWIWTGAGVREYGIATTGPREYLIVSTGRRGGRESWVYDPASPEAGLFTPGTAKDFDKDIVLWNGRFIRAPKK